MAIAVDLAEEEPAQLGAVTGVRRRRRPRVVPLVALLAVVAVLVFVLGNERQANTQFEQAHDSLVQTRALIAAADVQLTAVRQDLRFLKVQVTASETALSSDSALLQSVRTALVQAEKNSSDKSSYIGNLKACQGGVQQALNALSVGDQNHAVSALNGVSTACRSAAAAGG